MSKDLSTAHISANLANYEAARSGFFSLIVHDIDNIVSATYTGELSAATENDKIGKQAQEGWQQEAGDGPGAVRELGGIGMEKSQYAGGV